MNTRIVILGAGFAGLYTALRLERQQPADTELTLVSRDNYFLMTPLLFEAASGVLDPRDVVSPVRRMLRRTRFLQACVEQIDVRRRQVHCRHAPGDPIWTLDYDILVVAMGGESNLRLVQGSEHALTLKSLADAIYLRNHVIDVFERAEIESDPQRRRALLTFVIVGGGLVGAEWAGELSSFVSNLSRYYPRAARDHVRVVLVEAGPRVMSELPQEDGRYASGVLTDRLGIDIRTHERVQRIEAGEVILSSGEVLAAGTTVYAAGVAPSSRLSTVELPRDERGRLLVYPTLQSVEDPSVWALGDCAHVPDENGQPYPPLAQHALRQAAIAAGNILAYRRGQSLKPFRHRSLGMLASLGHRRGVGRVAGWQVRGFIAWWIWRMFYLWQLPGIDRKLRVLANWTVALAFRPDIVKLSLFGRPHPSTLLAEQEEVEAFEHRRAA